MRPAVFACFTFAAILPALAAPGEDCRQMRKLGQKAAAAACFDRLTLSRDPAARAEGF